jgi:hypothetical protein
MKHTARLILAATICMLCSCAGLLSFFASPTGQTVLGLADAGLSIAAATGKIKDGDRIVISKGLAIVTSPGSTTGKVFSLAALGLTKAIADGHIKTGDFIRVEGDSIIIKPAIIPTTAAKEPSRVNP